jgi:hypothetical protein
VETLTATEESSAAASMVLEAASSSNVLKMLEWRISNRLERAKTKKKLLRYARANIGTHPIGSW